jgi:hypothetical protein
VGQVVGVAEHLRQAGAKRQAAVERRAHFSQGRDEIVVRGQGMGRCNHPGFLAAGIQVQADAALALHGQQMLVEQPAAQHALVHADELGPRQRGHGRVHASVLVENLHQPGGARLVRVGESLDATRLALARANPTGGAASHSRHLHRGK